MLQNNPFYWRSIYKTVVAFGTVFADIHIVRTDKDGNPVTTIEVPCEFGPKEKWLTRNTQNPMPGTDDQIEMVLPRMSYEITGFTYDEARKITSTGRTVKAITNDKTILQAQYNPVPYNIGFVLNIMTKTIEDGLMIIEQILPFFTPDYTVTVLDIPDLDLLKDINIVLNGVSHEDSWDGSFQERRTVTWTLNFTAKAYLYPPVKLNKVTLETDVYYRVDGGAAQGVDMLPSFKFTPNPPPADAHTITGAIVSKLDTTVKVLASPSTGTLSPGQSKQFTVTVINARVPNPNPTNILPSDFLVVVLVTDQTGSDSYITDPIHSTFTYTCGSGLRITQETITIAFVSACDSTSRTTVTVTLNPT